MVGKRGEIHAVPLLFKRVVTTLLTLIGIVPFVALAESQRINLNILYLEQIEQKPAVLSNILPEAEDSGLRGAELAVADNNIAGRFLNQNYQLETLIEKSPQRLLERARAWVAEGNGVIVANLPEKTLLALLSQPLIQTKGLVFNVGSESDELRRSQCRSRMLHTLPSRAMRADALIQYLVAKRWHQWLLIKGQQPGDALFADALQRAAQRFGGKIIATKTWSFDTDLRRTAQKELPLFTQTKSYHVTLVADETGDVGEYVLYNTWHPRPVAGTQGLIPVGWHRVVEQWGAAQLQNRFTELAGRWMNNKDYAAWIAVRAAGEAVTQTASTDASLLYRQMLSENFELAGFKGRKLSFRNWNGQLRQPMPVVHPRALVSQSPQEGFLHPVTDLDTLGIDPAETSCQFQTL